MRDQPSILHDNNVSPRHAPQARATLVQVRSSAAVVPGWIKRGAGYSSLALLAVLCWAALRQDLPVEELPPAPPPAAPVEIAAAPPPPAVPPASSPLLAPDTAGMPDPADIALPPIVVATAPAEGLPLDSYEMTVRLEKGDTLASILRDQDIPPDEVARVIAALKPHLNLTRLQVDQDIHLEMRTLGQGDATPVLQALAIRPEARKEITLERDEDGSFSVHKKIFEVVAKLVRATGKVDGSLIGSLDAAGVPHSARAEVVRAFSWDVSFQHDMKIGDRFDVLVEQSWTSDGRLVDSGRVLWAEITTGGGRKELSVYRFKPQNGAEFFWYGDGQSVVKALLRTPLNLSRVSSRFGMRRHPVLGFTRMHSGIDFAAPSGTPVLAAGAGKVVQAGRRGGYGNWVKILHAKGLATGYAHLRRIARGIRPGARVRQGQVIGFVGSTGMSTGPHLHFELHRKGRPVNPLNVARTALRAKLAGKDLARFKAVMARINRQREEAPIIE